MRSSLLLAAVLVMACSAEDNSVVGVWSHLEEDPNCLRMLTLRDDNTYTERYACEQHGEVASEIYHGSYQFETDLLVKYTVRSASCPLTEAVGYWGLKPHRDGTLTVINKGAIEGYDGLDMMKLKSAGLTVRFGCFDAQGNFTARGVENL